MSDPVKIGMPLIRLTFEQRRIKNRLDAGWNKLKIARSLRICFDHLNEQIAQIRLYEHYKEEEKMANWSSSEVEKLIQLHEDGMSYVDIADRLGRDYKAVNNMAYRLRKAGRIDTDTTKGTTQDTVVHGGTRPDEEETTQPAVVHADAQVEIPESVLLMCESRLSDLQESIDTMRRNLVTLLAEQAEISRFIGEKNSPKP